MGRRISDMSGSVIAPGGSYPQGRIKNAPAGTRVNEIMLGDIVQLFQVIGASTGVTFNGNPDNTANGFQYIEALTNAMNNYAVQATIARLGSSYSSSTVYIISGCATATQSGYVLYNGKIYRALSDISVACGSGLVPAFALTSPLTYSNGVQQMSLTCLTSGTGVADYSAAVHLNSWTDFTPVFGAGAGGSITVDSGDIKSARYKMEGKTCFVQVRLEGITVTSAPSYISMTLPFLAANAFKNPTQYDSCGFYLAPSGATLQTLHQQTINGATPSVRGYASSGFVAGTDDSNVYFNLTFEVV